MRSYRFDEVSEKLFGRRVRVWDAQSSGVLAEGKVIAYTDRPTIVVREDDETRQSWIIDLPIEIIDPATPKPTLADVPTKDLVAELHKRNVVYPTRRPPEETFADALFWQPWPSSDRPTTVSDIHFDIDGVHVATYRPTDWRYEFDDYQRCYVVVYAWERVK